MENVEDEDDDEEVLLLLTSTARVDKLPRREPTAFQSGSSWFFVIAIAFLYSS
jgi:hypothetical protein